MNRISAPLAFASLLLASVALPACARECAPVVSEGWVRMPPVAMPMLAGFGRITNTCDTPVTIVGARSDAFGEVTVHETRIIEGVSRMRPVPTLRVDAKGEAVLQPGGLHLMLMQPKATLAPGDRIRVEFELEGGGVLAGDFEVRGPGG